MFLKKSHGLFRGRLIAFVLTLAVSIFSFGNSELGYDPGPNPATPEGQGYIDILNATPHFPIIGRLLNGGYDKFRYPFGVMPWRGPLEKDSVKILVIGQDGTHIAEAAGRPFTGGTGGRVQNALEFMGVRESAMFINTFSYTIKGQYADYAPIVRNGRVRWTQFLSPEAYLLGQDLKNPIVKWRNDFIEHIIDSNRNSLKLIICIGGAAADSLATFVKSRGGKAPTFYNASNIDQIQAIQYKSVWAEKNRYKFYPIDSRGRNVLLRDGEDFDPKDEDKWNILTRRAQGLYEDGKMVEIKEGIQNTGIFHYGQLGHDMYKVQGNSDAPVGSLKNLNIKNGPLSADIRVLKFRHPGSLSPTLQQNFRDTFEKLEDYKEAGWVPNTSDDDYRVAKEDVEPADKDFCAKGETPQADDCKKRPKIINKVFAQGHGPQTFEYRPKPSIPAKDFPLGKSEAVIINKSLAARSGAQIIVFGGRGRGSFGRANEEAAKAGLPSEGTEFYKGTQPWNPHIVTNDAETAFDQGPGKSWAKLFRSIEKKYDEIFKPKMDGNRRMSIDDDGMKALNVKNRKEHGAFGHFRGKTAQPEIVVIADPSSKDLDDMYSARALTGGEGQRLHGFLTGLKNDKSFDNYLVLKTLPFDMTGANDTEWKAALKASGKYTQNIVRRALNSRNQAKIVITIGEQAKKIAQKLKVYRSGSYKKLTDVEKVYHIVPGKEDEDYKDAFDAIKADDLYASGEYSRKSQSIPRTHLPYPMQAWVGTSGSRGLRSGGRNEGLFYGIVTPDWVMDVAETENQVASMLGPEVAFLIEAQDRVNEAGFSRLGRTMSRSQSDSDSEFDVVTFDRD